MPGTVHKQFVRCGKSNCKCASGEPHGPYFYHFARIGGKLKKRYLKAFEAEAARTACLSRQVEKRSELESERQTWKVLRKMREELRAIINLNK